MSFGGVLLLCARVGAYSGNAGDISLEKTQQLRAGAAISIHAGTQPQDHHK
jgi:hypothetical protein